MCFLCMLLPYSGIFSSSLYHKITLRVPPSHFFVSILCMFILFCIMSLRSTFLFVMSMLFPFHCINHSFFFLFSSPNRTVSVRRRSRISRGMFNRDVLAFKNKKEKNRRRKEQRTKEQHKSRETRIRHSSD